jgi:putative membrane protein
MGHAVFFDLPGSAITGAVIMGAVAVPFAVALMRRRGRDTHTVTA